MKIKRGSITFAHINSGNYKLWLDNHIICVVRKDRYDLSTVDFLNSLIDSLDYNNHIIAFNIIVNKWNEFHEDDFIDLSKIEIERVGLDDI